LTGDAYDTLITPGKAGIEEAYIKISSVTNMQLQDKLSE
jgi:hypothetical protein